MEVLLCIQVQINTDGSNDSYINAAKAAGVHVLASAVIFFLPIYRQTEILSVNTDHKLSSLTEANILICYTRCQLNVFHRFSSGDTTL